MRKLLISVFSFLTLLTPNLTKASQPLLEYHVRQTQYKVCIMLPPEPYLVAAKAISIWNTTLKRDIFVWVDDPLKADIVIYLSPNMSQDSNTIAGVTYWMGGGKSVVMIGDKYALALIVYVHELGHALGLAHSDNVNSIMYPSVNLEISFQKLLKETIQALR